MGCSNSIANRYNEGIVVIHDRVREGVGVERETTATIHPTTGGGETDHWQTNHCRSEGSG